MPTQRAPGTIQTLVYKYLKSGWAIQTTVKEGKVQLIHGVVELKVVIDLAKHANIIIITFTLQSSSWNISPMNSRCISERLGRLKSYNKSKSSGVHKELFLHSKVSGEL